jgi:hypothetical protein
MSVIAGSDPGLRSYAAPEPTREILPDTRVRSGSVPGTRPGCSTLQIAGYVTLLDDFEALVNNVFFGVKIVPYLQIFYFLCLILNVSSLEISSSLSSKNVLKTLPIETQIYAEHC